MKKFVELRAPSLMAALRRYDAITVEFWLKDGTVQGRIVDERITSGEQEPLRYPFAQVHSCELSGPLFSVNFMDEESDDSASPTITAILVYRVPSALRSWAEHAQAHEVLHERLILRSVSFADDLDISRQF